MKVVVGGKDTVGDANRIVQSIPASYTVWMDGTQAIAESNIKGGTDYTTGTGLTVVQNAISALGHDGGTIAIRDMIDLNGTLTIDRPIRLVGEGPGLLWNNYNQHPSGFRWIGTTNSIPMIKFLGNASVSAELDIQGELSNLAVTYSGVATGTDAVYIDGENSIARRINFDKVHIIGFSGIGIHSKGTVFDVHYYSVGVADCDGGGVKIEVGTPLTGNPTQHFFYGPILFSNTASTYALSSAASVTGIYGGTIANNGNGNGVVFVGTEGNVMQGVNVEGASVAATEGVTYTGTGLTIEGGYIINWATGFKCGLGTAAAAIRWYVNSVFGTNTLDFNITAGGTRFGHIGPTANASLTSLTNARRTTDNVAEILRHKDLPTSPTVQAVGGSPYEFVNDQDFDLDIMVIGGTVTKIEFGDVPDPARTYYDLGVINGQFHLGIYESLRVTYAVAPTMYYVLRP